MRKEARMCAFSMVFLLVLFVFFAVSQTAMDNSAIEKVAEVLGQEWRTLEKGDIILKEDGTIYVVLGTSTFFSVAAQIHVQTQPGIPWSARNRSVVLVTPALPLEVGLVRQTDPRYSELRQKFELAD